MFRFFSSDLAEAIEEPQEDTQVTQLFKTLDEKLEKNLESMSQACEKAEELEKHPKLRLAVSSIPPPFEASGTAE